MTRLTLSITGILLGVVVMLIGTMARQLPIPGVPVVQFRSLGPLSQNLSFALTVGGIVAVLCSLILGSATPKAVALLRYSGLVAVVIGVFVDGFRVPATFQVHFNLINPVPSNLMLALIALGVVLMAFGVSTLVRSPHASHSPRRRSR